MINELKITKMKPIDFLNDKGIKQLSGLFINMNLKVDDGATKKVCGLLQEYADKQLLLYGVINWVATKDKTPIDKQMVMICLKDTLMICGYKSPCWEDLKPEYWASIDNIKRPCL